MFKLKNDWTLNFDSEKYRLLFNDNEYIVLNNSNDTILLLKIFENKEIKLQTINLFEISIILGEESITLKDNEFTSHTITNFEDTI